MNYRAWILACWLCWCGWSCTSLPPFHRQLDAQMLAGRTVGADYGALLRYFGFLSPGADPDELREQRKVYMIYLWVGEPLGELGVRLLSPVRAWMNPPAQNTEGASTSGWQQGQLIVQDPYFAINQDTPFFFPPLFWLERCAGLLAIDGDQDPACTHWQILAESQPEPHIPATNRESKGNGQIRFVAHAEQPLQQLPAGLYRIVLTHGDVGEAQGSFLLEFGLFPACQQVAIGRTLPQLWQYRRQPGGPMLSESP